MEIDFIMLLMCKPYHWLFGKLLKCITLSKFCDQFHFNYNYNHIMILLRSSLIIVGLTRLHVLVATAAFMWVQKKVIVFSPITHNMYNRSELINI